MSFLFSDPANRRFSSSSAIAPGANSGAGHANAAGVAPTPAAPPIPTLAGKPIIKGRRLSVEFVVGLLGDGWSEADVLRNYPNITHDDVSACLRYAGEILRAEKVYPLTTV